jgi:hypothetical protein
MVHADWMKTGAGRARLVYRCVYLLSRISPFRAGLLKQAKIAALGNKNRQINELSGGLDNG